MGEVSDCNVSSTKVESDTYLVISLSRNLQASGLLGYFFGIFNCASSPLSLTTGTYEKLKVYYRLLMFPYVVHSP